MTFKISIKNALAELAKVKAKVDERRAEVISSKVKAMFIEMKNATPIDTGNARDSWTLTETGGKQKPYRVSNSAPYIEHLNAGSSKQAPPFFIDKIALKYGKPVGAVVTIKENPEA